MSKFAKAYERLKLSLWKPFEHDRDGYTERKTEFVRKYTQMAIEQYGKEKYR
ncbi:GrpB family protein [Caproicibacterium sp. NSD3]